MCDKNTNDESDVAIDLSLTRPAVLKVPPTPLSRTKTSEKKNVLAARPSNIGDKKQFVEAEASETKGVILLPKKRPYVVPQTQTEEKQITHNTDIVTKQTEAVKEVIAALPTNQVLNQSGATDKKSQAPELAASDKPTVKPVRKTEKKQSQKASASQPSTGQASTSQPSTSQASASQPSTSKTSKSQASTSKASKSKASTSKASKSKASTSNASKSKASTSNASKSEASTSKASKSKASTSNASKSEASTSNASKSKASTSNASKSKASTSHASKSEASTSKASKSRQLTSGTTSKTSSTPDSFQVRKGADSNLPSGKKPSASTSTASSSSSSADPHFWLETLKSKFQFRGFKNLLTESNFTERQAEVLQNLFHQAARRMYNPFRNSDRVMKVHSCQDCVFSICHHCVSVHFLPADCANADPKIPTVVAPHTMTICICQFAFFHAHTSRPSLSETSNTDSLKRIIASLRCPFCDTMVMIEHPQVENTDCTLTKWSGINSSDEETFHAQLVNHIKNFTQQTLSLDELYTCNHHCCLFFHRCTE